MHSAILSFGISPSVFTGSIAPLLQRTVDVTVRRLREKIEEDPANPERILTKRGVGYYYNAQ